MMSTEGFPPEPGTKLEGRYVVEETLGSGGMGVVMLAKHLGLRRHVAIKLLRPEFAKSPEVVTRFLREARATARLKSEHVVTVLDVGTLESGIPYFVMDYLQGKDLNALVANEGPLEVTDVIDYALQTLETLAEAHRAGIVHRDLKPPNLFLTTREDGSGLVKVLDFGVSKLIGWEVTGDGIVTREGKVLGSPLYMSPEQIRDASRVDARTDIWSLGAVMHELLTGRPPFDHQELPRLIRAICADRYRLPERGDIPDELFEILFQCMRKDRDERFQNAQELARAFQPIVRFASGQVSIDRILRSRASAPSLQRLTPIPEPSLVSTDPERSLPSVTPVERDTPPSASLFAPWWTGVRAGLVVAAVYGAFVFGRHHADDAQRGAPVKAANAPSSVLAPAVTESKSRANVVPERPEVAPARKLPPSVPSSAPSVADKSIPSATVRRIRVAASPKTQAPIASPAPGAAANAPPSSADVPPAFATRIEPSFRRARKLDTDNPFVKRP